MMPPEPHAGRRRWFAANGCRLAIDEPGEGVDPAVRPLGDAVLLGAHDELLDVVRRWTGVDHDWAPLEGAGEGLALTHSIASRTGEARQLGLILSDELLARTAASAASVGAEARIRAHAVTARLRLDRLLLTPDEHERLVPGSLLLLPASFAGNWIATLECDPPAGETDPPREASVFVQPGSGLLYFRDWRTEDEEALPADRPGAGEGVPCVVHLDAPVPLSLDAWLDAEPADGTCTMTDAFRRPRLSLGIDGRIVPAALVPVGDGYAALTEAAWT